MKLNILNLTDFILEVNNDIRIRKYYQEETNSFYTIYSVTTFDMKVLKSEVKSNNQQFFFKTFI